MFYVVVQLCSVSCLCKPFNWVLRVQLLLSSADVQLNPTRKVVVVALLFS